jgi:hypothetical protein
MGFVREVGGYAMSGSSTSPRAAHASFRDRHSSRHKQGSEGRAAKLTRVFALAHREADKTLNVLARTLVPSGDTSPPQRNLQPLSALNRMEGRPGISGSGDSLACRCLSAGLPEEGGALDPDAVHQHCHRRASAVTARLWPRFFASRMPHAFRDDQRFTLTSRMCAAS